MSASGGPVMDFFATPRFEIVRHLGSGGMGSVYEAFDCELEARVALKRLNRCEPQQLIRFKREFRDFQNLSHPNLVTLRELFSDGAEWFFSMELLDGVDFLEHVRPLVELDTHQLRRRQRHRHPYVRPRPTRSDRLRQGTRRWVRGPLDEHRLRRALPQLALGIQALHDAGKLHCDIKPSNVIVTRDDRVVLVDYGVAVDLRDRRAHDGSPARSRTWLPSRQRAERPARAADWYAVGVMLYEALTGGAPTKVRHRRFSTRSRVSMGRRLAASNRPRRTISQRCARIC